MLYVARPPMHSNLLQFPRQKLDDVIGERLTLFEINNNNVKFFDRTMAFSFYKINIKYSTNKRTIYYILTHTTTYSIIIKRNII